MKEDEVDREKRRASTEKHKTALDTEKKKEKKKNIKRHVLEQHWAQARCEGSPKEDSLDEDDDSEGMAARLNRLLHVPPQVGALPSSVEATKGLQDGKREGRWKEASPHRPHANTLPAAVHGRADLPPCPPQAFGSSHRVKTARTRPLT